MATLPSILPSGHASCHRELIYPCALFIDTCTCTDHTHAHATALTDWHRPSSASPCFSSSVAPHLHLFMEKVTVATWPAIWRGPARYPKQAKHNPITPQGDTPHLLNSAWVIFGFTSGTYDQLGTRINRCLTSFILLLPLECYIRGRDSSAFM